MSDPTADLHRSAREYVARYLPGRLVRRIRLDLDGEEQVVLPVPACSGPGAYTGLSSSLHSADPDRALELRDLVLEALADSDRPLKAVILARRCGRKYDGHLRRTLRELADAGDILHNTAEKTYRIADDE